MRVALVEKVIRPWRSNSAPNRADPSRPKETKGTCGIVIKPQDSRFPVRHPYQAFKSHPHLPNRVIATSYNV